MNLISGYLIIMALGFPFIQGNSVNAQNTNQSKPKENIKVNKKFDSKGNMIYYDSTYTWSSSGNEPNIMFHDTVITGDPGDMQRFFDQEFGFNNPLFMNPFFGNDSIMNIDPFGNDFFQRQFQMQDSLMNELYKRSRPIQADSTMAPTPEERNVIPKPPQKQKSKSKGKSVDL